MKFVAPILAGLILCFHANAQDGSSEKFSSFAETVDQSLQMFYKEQVKGENFDSIQTALGHEEGEIPFFSDDIYCQRIEELAAMSPMPYACNDATLKTLKFFVEKRRNFTKVVLGRSALYFDMYEKALDRYGLPLELKYLSVIESGLRPQVRSRSGALGLWQFMYGTGKMFGLQETSYIDERMDPEKATEAACQYLKKLYGIYDDWFLALAAYNAGPGNVNKAIRRSGGKKTYWEVRPFLPRETQGYVPNFIAASYMLTYHKEHNIDAYPAKIHALQTDTLCVTYPVHMKHLALIADWELDDIKALNPKYKTDYIPKTTPKQCIRGPIDKIGLLVSQEKRLADIGTYGPDSALRVKLELPPLPTSSQGVVKSVQHQVKPGESLTTISAAYQVSVKEIIEWNSLSDSKLSQGQELTIHNPKRIPVATPPPPPPAKYYRVRSGDTFSVIARRHGMTQSQLRRLNPRINISRLSIGQKIRIK